MRHGTRIVQNANPARRCTWLHFLLPGYLQPRQGRLGIQAGLDPQCHRSRDLRRNPARPEKRACPFFRQGDSLILRGHLVANAQDDMRTFQQNACQQRLIGLGLRLFFHGLWSGKTNHVLGRTDRGIGSLGRSPWPHDGNSWNLQVVGSGRYDTIRGGRCTRHDVQRLTALFVQSAQYNLDVGPDQERIDWINLRPPEHRHDDRIHHRRGLLVCHGPPHIFTDTASHPPQRTATHPPPFCKPARSA